MHNQSTSDSPISKLLDQLHRSDLPSRTLLTISFLISFVWIYHSTEEILPAAVGAMFARWLMLMPVGFCYFLLFIAALAILTITEYFAAAVFFFRSLYAKTR